jgi:hypothetical protein
MSLPVTREYLLSALQDGYQLNGMTLSHRHVGDLALPSGQLVACDPFVQPEKLPFNLSLPAGTVPVVLSIAHLKTDQRVAFAVVYFSKTLPEEWEMMIVGDQDPSTLKEDEFFGYGVDAGTGCFMDKSARQSLTQRMNEQQTFYEVLMAEMDKTQINTWSWLDMKFGDGNLIAFSSGYGDGLYATYAGRDSNGHVSVVVTDFGVLPLEKPVLKPAKKGFSDRLLGFLRK